MRPQSEFVHLHNHSEYSLMDGTTRWSDHSGKAPSELLQRLASEGARAIAVTDHGNLYGAIEFYTRCRKVGIKPIIGCEMYLAKNSRFDKKGSQKANCHLTVLARNFEGYQNLMALSSKGFLEGYYYDPRIDKEILAQHSKGLIVLSGCLKSELNQLIAEGDLKAAAALAAQYRDILEPGMFYLEIMDHGLEKQRQALKALLEIHKKTGIPLIATNDCHYAGKNDFTAHDARVCISTGKKIAETNRLRFESHEFYYKSAAEMMKIFHFAPDSVSNSLEIAEKCNLEIPMGESILPTFPLPEGYTQDSYVEKLCRDGLKAIEKNESTAYQERLEYELGIIKRMGYSGYFLIVWDFILWAKKQEIPVGPGRGSGAGALVCFTLGITAVDPIEHDLLFERFLNPDRISMPDLDIDFSDEGRARVIEYVRDKYGHENVAQIITFGSLKARLAIRDVGRVMDVPLSEVDKLAKLIPLGNTLHQALDTVPELQQAAADPQTRKLLDLAKKLEGLKRHTGVHAAGIVITKEAVVKYAPLAKQASSDVITTQYDGDWLPELGLLKMDFLGLRNLTIIDDAVKLIKARLDPSFDLAKIPANDPKSFALLQSGKALGVFQLDSEGMRELLRRLKPTKFEDISACIALYRPGPMSSGMLDLFVERKHGKKVRYDHPLMEPILNDTYGCMIYQEQVMAIAKSLAGFTPGEADVLRKAMGKKVPEVMEKLRAQFVEGCQKNKIADKLATKVFEQILKFGGYGFNKSHTVAYGTLSYQTAYLKANFPVEYYTALFTSEIGHSAIAVEGKENKLVTYLEDAKAAGFTIHGPCVNKSFEKFAIEDEKDGPAIRFGLTAVKSVGHGAAESIVSARQEGGLFKSLDDFCRRVDLKAANKKCLESLIMAGAMDSLMAGLRLEEARARLTATLESTVGRQARIKDDLAIGQGLLFGTDLPVARVNGDEAAENIEAWHEHDLLKHERSVLGFYLSGHPLVRYRDLMGCVSSHPIEGLAALGEDAPKQIRLAGMIASVKKIITRKGEPMARGVLEDLSGEITMLVFPKAYASGLGEQMKSNAIVAVIGRLSFPANFRGEDDFKPEPELIVEEIMPIDMAINRYARALTLHFSTIGLEEELLMELKRVLRKHPGRIPVYIKLDTPSHGQTLVETEERVVLKDGLFEQLAKVLGEKAWKIESVS